MSFEPTIHEAVSKQDFVVLSLNKAAEKFLDCRRVDAVGHYLSDLADEWQSTSWGQALVESVRCGTLTDYELNLDEGEITYWYRVVINPLKEAVVVTMTDITQLKAREFSLEKLNQDLELLASTDPLTGVSNRRHFIEAAEEELERSRRYAFPLSVIVFDLDWFKRINDLYGHAAGDTVLVETVRLIQDRLRINDIIARMGGDEFAILLPNTDADKAQEMTQRLCADLASQKINIGSEKVSGTCSFGVCEFADANADVLDLVHKADQALYRAKQLGRNRVELAADNLTDQELAK
ncbi:MAG: sensor domain-containing diguanylate cyclase [Gammaproteobacteria bacterium]|nr:sensor domain-containing diguanylate cyclase [Gammaproteobacteria bacterium]